MMMFKDGLRNVLAGLGTVKEKLMGTTYQMSYQDPSELVIAYRTSAIARKVVDIPAEDATREWREWNADKDDITKIETEEKRLRLQRLVRRARQAARLTGGAALFIHTGEADVGKPLEIDRLGKGGIKKISLLSRNQLSAGDIDYDTESDYFNEPSSWTMNTQNTAGLQIHPSRLVIFKGEETPDQTMAQDLGGWGDSTLYSTLDGIKRADSTAANVAQLVFEAKLDIVKIPDLMHSLSEAGSAEYEKALLERWGLASQAKSLYNVLLMDKEEEWEQKQLTFATLPDVMKQFMQLVSAEADIPMTRMWGMSPGGLNATGDNDLVNYYDSLRSWQTVDLDADMELLNRALLRSSLGAEPEGVHHNWRPLWQPTAKERAEIGKSTADTLDKVFKMNLIPDEVMQKTAVNSLTENGVLPGLESELAAYYKEHPEEEGEFGGTDPVEEGQSPTEGDEGRRNDPAGAEGTPPTVRRSTAQDAAPRTLYVKRNVLNADEIKKWAKRQGFSSVVDDLHVTIAFSRDPIDWFDVREAWEDQLPLPAGGARAMEAFGPGGKAKVLLFKSRILEWRHSEILEHGASWDHPEYQPHITISYAEDAPDLSEVEPYTGPIILGPEYFEEVKEDWAKSIKEN